LPETFTGSRIGVESVAEGKLGDEVFCCGLLHPDRAIRKTNKTFNQRYFMPGIVSLVWQEFKCPWGWL
jgi:hypothetical protein